MYTSAYFDIVLPEEMARDTERLHLIGLLSVTFFMPTSTEKRADLIWPDQIIRKAKLVSEH